MSNTPDSASRQDRLTGLVYGSIGYVLWGIAPIYFKFVGFVSALELTAHRILWSFLLVTALLAGLGRWPVLRQTWADPRLRRIFALTGLLLVGNWLTFVYAIETGRVMACSLGYFMNPLWSVLLGRVFLRERVDGVQWLALGLAAAGVAVLVAAADGGIWLSLLICVSWGFYALLRKSHPIDSLVGLGVETAMVLPLALGLLTWLGLQGTGILGQGTWPQYGLLLLAAPVTAAPLIAFAAGQRRLTLAAMGLMQYMAPTMQFLLAVLLWREPFYNHHLIAFACIWTALALYSWQFWRRHRR